MGPEGLGWGCSRGTVPQSHSDCVRFSRRSGDSGSKWVGRVRGTRSSVQGTRGQIASSLSCFRPVNDLLDEYRLLLPRSPQAATTAMRRPSRLENTKARRLPSLHVSIGMFACAQSARGRSRSVRALRSRADRIVFSGSGEQALPPFRLQRPMTMYWANTGDRFQTFPMTSRREGVVSSGLHHGQAHLRSAALPLRR